MNDFRRYEGFLVPASESEKFLAKRVRQARTSVEAVLSHCVRRRVAVQAGGNLGLWPRRMAELFGAVYTFEPDAQCFDCLVANTRSYQNVIRLQAALGEAPALIDLCRIPRRSGSQYVDGHGIIPTLRIDDLALEACDLIYLDVEGSELAALRGAAGTIEMTRPVIAFEDKAHGERYDVAAGAVADWLNKQFGYRPAGRIEKHDQVMVPW